MGLRRAQAANSKNQTTLNHTISGSDNEADDSSEGGYGVEASRESSCDRLEGYKPSKQVGATDVVEHKFSKDE